MTDTALEALFKRDRVMVISGLVAIVLLCWAWVLPMARDMYGDMSGAAAWMMRGHWDATYFALMFGMWVAMMVGMMLPSAASAVLLYLGVVRNSEVPHRPVARAYAFAGGYVLAWTAFSLAATALQWGLSESGLLSPMMESTSRTVSGLILLAAGAYQFTPFKQACLSRCRSPLTWLPQHWKSGLRGATRMGVEYGLYCLGCCWMLMLLLFVGGVMSLAWIAGITLFVLIEKLAPPGVGGGKISGVALAVAGAVILYASYAG